LQKTDKETKKKEKEKSKSKASSDIKPRERERIPGHFPGSNETSPQGKVGEDRVDGMVAGRRPGVDFGADSSATLRLYESRAANSESPVVSAPPTPR
jgi:hypothetical protein